MKYHEREIKIEILFDSKEFTLLRKPIIFELINMSENNKIIAKNDLLYIKIYGENIYELKNSFIEKIDEYLLL